MRSEVEAWLIARLKEWMAGDPGVEGCLRCLGDHQHLQWRLFGRPAHVGEQKVYAWAVCPETWEPILLTASWRPA